MDKPEFSADQLEQVKWFFRWMEERCIYFSTGCPTGGEVNIEADDLIVFFNNEDQFWVNHGGVSIEQWLAFKDTLIRPFGQKRCKQITQKGTQCQNQLTADPVFDHAVLTIQVTPKEFRPGYHDRCRIHGGPKAEAKRRDVI